MTKLADISHYVMRTAWKRQLQISGLVEIVSDHLFHQIADLVHARTVATIQEMANDSESSEFASMFDGYPQEEAATAAAVYPNVLLSSLFASSYFFFEYDLNRVCHLLRDAQQYELKLGDISGSGIHRAKTYLNKVAGIPFPEDAALWQEIVSYGQLRNLISHNGGVLDSSDAARKADLFVRGHSQLAINDEGWVTLSPEFVVDVSYKLQDAFLVLDLQLNEWRGVDLDIDELEE